MSPAMVQAAGRGEHHPIAANDSPENKAKNRRTDIIITPNYGEIAAILGQ
jgi:chemotaxis protein MotB